MTRPSNPVSSNHLETHLYLPLLHFLIPTLRFSKTLSDIEDDDPSDERQPRSSSYYHWDVERREVRYFTIKKVMEFSTELLVIRPIMSVV